MSFLQKRIIEIIIFESIFFTLLGLYFPYASALKSIVPILVFLMILQPMFAMNFSVFRKAWKRKFKLLLVIAFLYVVVYPLLTFAFAVLWPYTGLSPEMVAGAVITALAPVAMPAPAFVAALGGDIELSVASVILTFMLSLIVIPLWSSVILHAIVSVPVYLILKSIVLYIVVPLIVGRILRILLSKNIEKANNVLLTISLLAMYILIGIVFMNSAKAIVSMGIVIAIFVATVFIYHGIRAGIADAVARIVKAEWKEKVALVYASTVNGALGMAISLGTYGPVAAAGAVITGPFSVLILMGVIAKILSKTKTQ